MSWICEFSDTFCNVLDLKVTLFVSMILITCTSVLCGYLLTLLYYLWGLSSDMQVIHILHLKSLRIFENVSKENRLVTQIGNILQKYKCRQLIYFSELTENLNQYVEDKIHTTTFHGISCVILLLIACDFQNSDWWLVDSENRM